MQNALLQIVIWYNDLNMKLPEMEYCEDEVLINEADNEVSSYSIPYAQKAHFQW